MNFRQYRKFQQLVHICSCFFSMIRRSQAVVKQLTSYRVCGQTRRLCGLRLKINNSKVSPLRERGCQFDVNRRQLIYLLIVNYYQLVINGKEKVRSAFARHYVINVQYANIAGNCSTQYILFSTYLVYLRPAPRQATISAGYIYGQ